MPLYSIDNSKILKNGINIDSATLKKQQIDVETLFIPEDSHFQEKPYRVYNFLDCPIYPYLFWTENLHQTWGLPGGSSAERPTYQ